MVVVEGIIDTVVVVVVTWCCRHHRGSRYHGDMGSMAIRKKAKVLFGLNSG